VRAKPRRFALFHQTKDEVLVVCGGQTERIYFNAFKRVFRPSLGNISVITAAYATYKPISMQVANRENNYFL
jgi:hypothetical protein